MNIEPRHAIRTSSAAFSQIPPSHEHRIGFQRRRAAAPVLQHPTMFHRSIFPSRSPPTRSPRARYPYSTVEAERVGLALYFIIVHE